MEQNLIKNEERKMRQDMVATEIKKENFIRDILDKGLGQEILSEPNTVHVEKKISFFDKLKLIIIKLFLMLLFHFIIQMFLIEIYVSRKVFKRKRIFG